MASLRIISATLCLLAMVHAKLSIPDPPKDFEEELENVKLDVYRYENPINRDHFYYVGIASNLKFSDFKFEDYRFDGYVATILSQDAIPIFKEKYPDALPYVLPVYHGYHKDMKHNYYSKPWEPSFEGPVFYCMRRPGLVGATKSLWTLDGQPIDANGNLGYDTIYTTTLVERDLPNVEDYVMYRVLCYTWPPPESEQKQRVKAALGEEGKKDPFAHTIAERFTRIYQFFNEHTHDHYYKSDVEDPTLSKEDRANFQNVVAMLIDPAKASGLLDCDNVTNLVQIFQAYDAKGTDSLIFVGQDNIEKAKKDGIILKDPKLLGYAAKTQRDCQSRYQLFVRIKKDNKLYEKQNTTQQGENFYDQDVYIAPKALNTTDPLFYDQSFWIW